MSKEPGTPRRWSRGSLDHSGPNRSAGGFYRTSEDKDRKFGGVPLTTANAAVVAAVKLAYKVAEAQVDRSMRLARGLRDAGDREVGPGSDRKALDATEKLVMKALMSGLSWWEASVAEGRCPVKRLVAAEYRMLGTILGFTPSPGAKDSVAPVEESRAADPEIHRAPQGSARRSSVYQPNLRIMHIGKPELRRPVLVQKWIVNHDAALDAKLYFYCPKYPKRIINADIVLTGKKGGEAELRIEMINESIAGLWRAAICDEKGVQLGFIEIVL